VRGGKSREKKGKGSFPSNAKIRVNYRAGFLKGWGKGFSSEALQIFTDLRQKRKWERGGGGLSSEKESNKRIFRGPEKDLRLRKVCIL